MPSWEESAHRKLKTKADHWVAWEAYGQIRSIRRGKREVEAQFVGPKWHREDRAEKRNPGKGKESQKGHFGSLWKVERLPHASGTQVKKMQHHRR